MEWRSNSKYELFKTLNISKRKTSISKTKSIHLVSQRGVRKALEEYHEEMYHEKIQEMMGICREF